MIITDSNGNPFVVQATPYDAVAASTAYLQAVANLNLRQTNLQQSIADQLAAELSDAQADVAQQLADLTAALAIAPNDAAQANIDSAASQFPSIVAAITPAQTADQKTPPQTATP